MTDGEYSAEYHYLANSPLVEQIEFRNGEAVRMTTVKKYDRLNRLLSIASQPSTDSPISYTYAYNLANQRTNVLMADGAGWDYGYDFLGQLTNAVRFDGKRQPLPNGVYQYAYDDIGNRRKALTAGVEVEYRADALNRYTNSVARNAGALKGQPAGSVLSSDAAAAGSLATGADADSDTAASAADLVGRTGATQYDADGNLTADASWTYQWDAENRLIAMESGAGILPAKRMRLEFAYDTQSRRVAKTVYGLGKNGKASKPTTSLAFIYDGWNLIAELDQLAGAQAPVATYAWGLDLSGSLEGAGGVGGLLCSKQFSNGHASSASFYAYDGNGNVVGLAGSNNGDRQVSSEQDPFGGLEFSSMSSVFAHATKYTDTETGLMYYGYRYYSHILGRWLTVDPVTEAGGVNIYAFVCNNPLNAIDLLGLEVSQLQEYSLSLAQDRQRFINALITVCPGVNSITICEGRCAQTCTLSACIEQAERLADKYVSLFTVVFTKEYEKYGNIIPGWDGNLRANLAPHHGEAAIDYDKGYGLKCVGYSELSMDGFTTAIRPFRKAGSQCFRAATVGKPAAKTSDSNHSWLVIYGPNRGELTKTMFHHGEYDVVVDPWPTDGSLIMPYTPYVAQRLDMPVLW